jgi:hypothetical protein
MRLDIAEESRRVAQPLHQQLGQTIHLMWIFVDAWADHNWGVWDTALLADSDREKGWTPTRSQRLLHSLGLTSKGDVFEAAGLSKVERQVMEARFPDSGGFLLPREIAQQLDWPTLRVRVYLFRAHERLQKWARLVDPGEAL